MNLVRVMFIVLAAVLIFPGQINADSTPGYCFHPESSDPDSVKKNQDSGQKQISTHSLKQKIGNGGSKVIVAATECSVYEYIAETIRERTEALSDIDCQVITELVFRNTDFRELPSEDLFYSYLEPYFWTLESDTNRIEIPDAVVRLLKSTPMADRTSLLDHILAADTTSYREVCNRLQRRIDY